MINTGVFRFQKKFRQKIILAFWYTLSWKNLFEIYFGLPSRNNILKINKFLTSIWPDNWRSVFDIPLPSYPHKTTSLMDDPKRIPRPQCASVFVCVGILILQKSIKKYSDWYKDYNFWTINLQPSRINNQES